MNSYFSICRFEESFADFQLAFKKLRGNQLIDYKPLGLRYKLFACEVSVQEDFYSLDQIVLYYQTITGKIYSIRSIGLRHNCEVTDLDKCSSVQNTVLQTIFKYKAEIKSIRFPSHLILCFV